VGQFYFGDLPRKVGQYSTGVDIKGVHALIECIGGLALAVVSTGAIAALVNTLTQEELIEDPNDFVAMHLLIGQYGYCRRSLPPIPT
jgi:uncharacterized membrane protein